MKILDFLYLVIISNSIKLLNGQTINIRNITLAEFDQDEIFSLESFNSERRKVSLEPIILDQELMMLSQREAERLALINRLEFNPLAIDKRYHGFNRQILGKMDNNYIGSKICHDNFINGSNRRIIDINTFCGNFIDDFKIGMGRALSGDRRTLYSVTLFLVKMEERRIVSEDRDIEKDGRKEAKNNDEVDNTVKTSSGFVSRIWNFFKGVMVKIFS